MRECGKNLKEQLAKQAVLMYNLFRKIIGIEFPIALSSKMYSKNRHPTLLDGTGCLFRLVITIVYV